MSDPTGADIVIPADRPMEWAREELARLYADRAGLWGRLEAAEARAERLEKALEMLVSYTSRWVANGTELDAARAALGIEHYRETNGPGDPNPELDAALAAPEFAGSLQEPSTVEGGRKLEAAAPGTVDLKLFEGPGWDRIKETAERLRKESRSATPEEAASYNKAVAKLFTPLAAPAPEAKEPEAAVRWVPEPFGDGLARVAKEAFARAAAEHAPAAPTKEPEQTSKNGWWTAPLYEADDRTRVVGAPRIEHPYPPTTEWQGRTFTLKPGGHGKGGRLARYVAPAPEAKEPEAAASYWCLCCGNVEVTPPEDRCASCGRVESAEVEALRAEVERLKAERKRLVDTLDYAFEFVCYGRGERVAVEKEIYDTFIALIALKPKGGGQ